MPIPLSVKYERVFSGTKRRIFQLLVEMGTSGDVIWPFASQPFMRTSGPLEPGKTEEWHGGIHAVLADVAPEQRIVWKVLNDGVDGTHGFFVSEDGKKTRVEHRFEATLSDSEGRMLWRRIEDQHERQMEALFDKIARVLKR